MLLRQASNRSFGKKDMLEKVTNSMRPGGLFTTYSAKGQLKRDLRDLGLEVESPPGPPGKKRNDPSLEAWSIKINKPAEKR